MEDTKHGMNINDVGSREKGKQGQQNVDEKTSAIYGGDYALDPMTGKPGINIGGDNPMTKDVLSHKPGIKGGTVTPPTTPTNSVNKPEGLTDKIKPISVKDDIPKTPGM